MPNVYVTHFVTNNSRFILDFIASRPPLLADCKILDGNKEIFSRKLFAAI